MNQTHTTETPNAVLEAQNKINGIQQAIVDGNTKLTAADLSNARAALEFAELQQRARQIIEQEAAETERKAHLLSLQKRLTVIRDSQKTVDAKLESFTRSLSEYLTACSTFQNNLNSVRTALRENDLYPESDIITAAAPAGKLAYGVQIQDRLRTLTIGTISVTNLNPADSIKPILEKSVADYERNF
jgi:predicted  nucleic acid-binding Zn-ribbon protein